ncbi:MAG: GspE/PulE family protein [Candidatus Hinthialibacter antarcticus]|nr:GspE/PulE family protein [Candidatus Hinthialibacter antarcticus]
MTNNPGTIGRRYGELLRSLNMIETDDINRAIAIQEKTGKNLDTVLVDNGMVDETQMLDALSQHLGMESIEIKNIELPPEVLQEVPIRFVHRFNIIPVERRGDTLRIATGDPLNFNALDDLRLLLKCNIEPLLAPSDDIIAAIKKYYGIGADTMDSLLEEDGRPVEEEEFGDGNIEELSEDASIIRFVNQIMMEAVSDRATDIHIEPFEEELRIRYRIDGLLYEAVVPPSIRRYQAAVISRIKIMSDMNIAEKRLPQDGRINIRTGNTEFDLRVSTIPTPYGESIVIRILNRDSTIFDLKQLGFDEYSLERFENLITKPHGIILVTGPTGSGKTTTLYATLSKLNKMDVKILTIEEPIEYHLKGIVQVQVTSKIGLTFASVLRSFLRQDPDIILVGETRDHETAEIAIQAALTGHLVFTTLHTNDAPGAITRLIDMKVEPYLVSSSVIGVVAQRLMRRVCQRCKEECFPEHDMLRGLGLLDEQYKDMKFYHGRGCEDCKFLGYRGRTAIYEIFEMTEDLRELTVERVPASKIKQMALKEGLKTLRMSALEKVQQGESTVEELIRVTQEW